MGMADSLNPLEQFVSMTAQLASSTKVLAMYGCRRT
jgi:hypothetical protein